RYWVEDGNTQGYLSSERTFSSSATNGSSDIPGTDSNGQQTEYVYQDNAQSNSESSEEERNYLPSETITDKDIPPGTINYGLSTISLAATNMNVIREEDARAQGLLDGISWEEYKLANAGQSQVEVPDDLYDVVSKATGFPVENIAIVAYSENVFFDKEGLNVSGSDIVQIVLIVVILALLAFVVIRSMRSEKETEQPEELSVESLLQSQPDVELEDIGTEPMSETRRLIEKFVDENPEAVASLLRNWLNEGWG
ncbi:MAG: flagellar M-ring protein FliF, partial [Lachnospiraceae bacterium]|nr:flagellar M-ring protein FliF [Lachnospiraceae bacterium]